MLSAVLSTTVHDTQFYILKLSTRTTSRHLAGQDSRNGFDWVHTFWGTERYFYANGKLSRKSFCAELFRAACHAFSLYSVFRPRIRSASSLSFEYFKIDLDSIPYSVKRQSSARLAQFHPKLSHRACLPRIEKKRFKRPMQLSRGMLRAYLACSMQTVTGREWLL